MSKSLRIGLFGFGCVGQGLYDVFTRSKSGIDASIVRIAIKDPQKRRSLPAHYFTTQADDILSDPQINLVVELINNVSDAYQIVTTALRQGKNVVSANKKMIAEHFEELYQIQEQTGSALLYEASACGSIPIIRTLEEYYDNELLYAVRGIFNGSSNYILTKVAQHGLSYDEALHQAQQLGFAETDPTLDVGGFDAKYKLVILTAHSYGLFVRPEEVFNYGIQSLSDDDMRYAREKNFKIKLVPQVRRIGDHAITLYVMPQFVTAQNYLYEVENEYNGVIVEAAFSDQQFFRGKGAGGHPTGSAVLSDISASRYDYRYEYRKRRVVNGLRYTQEVIIPVYFRYRRADQFVPERFVSIREKYEGYHFHYVVGEVRLADLHHDPYFRQPDTFVVQWAEEIKA